MQNWQINVALLNEIFTKPSLTGRPFSNKKFISAIDKCSNLSAPSPDKVSWKYLKVIVKENKYLENIVNIVNTCINLKNWLMYFKTSLSIIISKLNKAFYISQILLLYHPPKYTKKINWKSYQGMFTVLFNSK